MSISRKDKQPRDVIDIDVTFPNLFELNPSDFIATVTPLTVSGTGASPDLILGPGTHPSYQILGSPTRTVKIWVGEGVDGVSYKVEGTMTTDQLRSIEFEFNVKVKNK